MEKNTKIKKKGEKDVLAANSEEKEKIFYFQFIKKRWGGCWKGEKDVKLCVSERERERVNVEWVLSYRGERKI